MRPRVDADAPSIGQTFDADRIASGAFAPEDVDASHLVHGRDAEGAALAPLRPCHRSGGEGQALQPDPAAHPRVMVVGAAPFGTGAEGPEGAK